MICAKENAVWSIRWSLHCFELPAPLSFPFANSDRSGNPTCSDVSQIQLDSSFIFWLTVMTFLTCCISIFVDPSFIQIFGWKKRHKATSCKCNKVQKPTGDEQKLHSSAVPWTDSELSFFFVCFFVYFSFLDQIGPLPNYLFLSSLGGEYQTVKSIIKLSRWCASEESRRTQKTVPDRC